MPADYLNSTPRPGVNYRYLVRQPGAPASAGVAGFGNELMVVTLAPAGEKIKNSSARVVSPK
jgi:hypothetical protein